jgi:hypothetical protein
MKNFKPIWITLAAMILLSLASCNTTPPMPDNTQSSSGSGVATKAAKYINPHFDHRGHLTSILHSMSLDEYYAIVDIILAQGGEPSPRNIDSVYDARH